MNWLTSPETWIALLTLTVLEIVLGIDNIIFISILAGKLPAGEQPRARTVGLTLAMVTRILLLLSLTGIMRLTRPLFSPLGHPFSGRDLILLLGGLFLLWKSTREIHDKLEGEEGQQNVKAGATFGGVIVQIALLDIVFSLDSVITAVGMVRQVGVMIAAIVLAVLVMLMAAGPISDFVHRHPTLRCSRCPSCCSSASRSSPTASANTSRRATSISRWASRCSSSRSTCACCARRRPCT